jgi:hypothetical protein
MFNYKGYEVSLFNGGRMLIKNVSNEQEALKAYREILSALNVPRSMFGSNPKLASFTEKDRAEFYEP